MNILENIWRDPYLAYVQLIYPIIVVLVLYFTIVGWNERHLVRNQLRGKTINLLVFYFTIIGLGAILYNLVFDLNLNMLFIDGGILIGVAYGLWNLKKWAGILGIFLTIETVAVNIYIDTFSDNFLYGSVLRYSGYGLVIILIIRNWNNLTPKSLIEYLNPIKRWINGRRKI